MEHPDQPRETTVQIHIDRLALEGFSLEPAQERVVQASLAFELGRLTEAQPLPARFQSGGAVAALPGGALHIQSWTTPADLGRQIATALYTGFHR